MTTRSRNEEVKAYWRRSQQRGRQEYALIRQWDVDGFMREHDPDRDRRQAEIARIRLEDDKDMREVAAHLDETQRRFLR